MAAMRKLGIGIAVGFSLLVTSYSEPLLRSDARARAPPNEELQEQEIRNGAGSEHRLLNVYGCWDYSCVDRRVFANPTTLPGRAVGRVLFPDLQYCTGTLVGRALLLTARHCFFGTDNKVIVERLNGRFEAGYFNGSVAGIAKFVHLWYGEGQDQWALLQLDRPLGSQVGYLTLSHRLWEPQELPTQPIFQMIAYSRDKFRHQAGLDPACTFEGFTDDDWYITSCSGEAGTSGAAIIDSRGQVVGVFVATLDQTAVPKVKIIAPFDERFPNFALPAAYFYNMYLEIRAVVDAGGGEPEGHIPEGGGRDWDQQAGDGDEVAANDDGGQPGGTPTMAPSPEPTGQPPEEGSNGTRTNCTGPITGRGGEIAGCGVVPGGDISGPSSEDPAQQEQQYRRRHRRPTQGPVG